MTMHPDIPRCAGKNCPEATRATCLRFQDIASGTSEPFAHMCGPQQQHRVTHYQHMTYLVRARQ